MLSGEGNSRERWKTTIGLISKKATLHVQYTFFARLQRETSRNFLVTRFMKEMSYVFSFPFFFTAANFHLALVPVAASISHFVTAATKFSCCSSNKNMSLLFFISRSRFLTPFFSLSSGLPNTFFFSLSFSCSIFQICGHDNYSKLNTWENTDTETYCRFPFSSSLTL